MYVNTTQAASLLKISSSRIRCDPQTQSVSSLLCRRLGEALFAVRRQSLSAQSVARRDFELCSCGTRTFRQLLQKGRVRGAYKAGKFWLIPLYNGIPFIEQTKRGQKGTWKTTKKLQKTTININSNIIRQNIKKNKQERKPAIAVKGKQKRYVHELEIPVPCKIIYNPDKPLSCGARVWIEILNFDLDSITC